MGHAGGCGQVPLAAGLKEVRCVQESGADGGQSDRAGALFDEQLEMVGEVGEEIEGFTARGGQAPKISPLMIVNDIDYCE